jgi:hypothetical protein
MRYNALRLLLVTAFFQPLFIHWQVRPVRERKCAMKKVYQGQVSAVLLGLDSQSLVTTHVASIQAEFEGLNGDKHAGLTRLSDGRTPHYPRGTVIRNDRQVSLVSVEELAEIAQRMKVEALLPDWLGANMLIQGIPDLTRILPSARMYFSQGAVLYISGENKPCIHPGKVIQAQYPDQSALENSFVTAALHRRGLVAVVENPGTITPGDEVQVEVPEQYTYTG